MIQEMELPNDLLQIKIKRDTEDKELFMSAGMLRAIVGWVGTADRFIDVFTDPQIQLEILGFILAPKGADGKVQEGFNLDTLEISPAEGDKVLKWVEAHILHFFIGNAKTLKASLESQQMKKLMALLSGMEDLQNGKPSSGPTNVEDVIS